MALVSWLRKQLWLTDVSNSRVSRSENRSYIDRETGDFPTTRLHSRPQRRPRMQSQLQEPWKREAPLVRVVQSRLEATCLELRVNTTEQEPQLGVHTLGLEP